MEHIGFPPSWKASLSIKGRNKVVNSSLRIVDPIKTRVFIGF